MKSLKRDSRINQCLHGYAEGHRLLACSAVLDEEVARTIGRLSDLSGPSGPKGFEQYLTGYPLPSIDAYALGYTWYAPEMPRPGCVWTHTLIIPNEVIGDAESLGDFIGFFARPTNKQVGQEYREPLELGSPRRPFEVCWDSPGALNRSKLVSIVDTFFSNPESPILVPACESSECLPLIDALWSLRLPHLRKRLAFSTGSLSSRTISSKAFDLQFVPSNLVREISREPSLGAGAVIVDFKREVSSWSEIAADSASRKYQDEFSMFISKVAEDDDGRDVLEKFGKLFFQLRTNGDRAGLNNLIETIVSCFPGTKEGRKLKNFVLGRERATELVYGFGEIDILRSLSKTEKGSSFDANELGLFERGKMLLEEQPELAQSLLFDLLRTHLSQVGETVVSGIIAGFDEVKAGQLAGTEPQLLPVLFAANPELACSSTLWLAACSKQSELFESIRESSKLSDDALPRIVTAMMNSGVERVAPTVLSAWGEVAVHAVLDWASMHHFERNSKWFDAARAYPSFILSWSEAAKPKSLSGVGFLSKLLNPDIPELREFDTTAWVDLLKNSGGTFPAGEAGRSFAFLAALGLAGRSADALKLVSAAFAPLHQLLAADRIAYEDWKMVEKFTPELGWLRSWDKCERLRRGLIAAFLRYSWPSEALTEFITDMSLLRDVSTSAREVDGGKRFIKELVRRIETGAVFASEKTLRALRRK